MDDNRSGYDQNATTRHLASYCQFCLQNIKLSVHVYKRVLIVYAVQKITKAWIALTHAIGR